MPEHTPSGAAAVLPHNGSTDPSLNVREMLGYAVDRLDDLRDAESRRVDEMVALRAQYEEKLALAETKRIDAIRAVDVNSVSVANEKATQQAAVLADQVASSAEALRGLVASTAATAAITHQQSATALSDRLTSLEQAQYTSTGKSAVADPVMAELINEVKQLRTSGQLTIGHDAGKSDTYNIVRSTVMVILAAGGFILGHFVLK